MPWGSPQHFPQLCQDFLTQPQKAAWPHSCLTLWPPGIFLCGLVLPCFSTSGSLFWCFLLSISSNKPIITTDIIKNHQVSHTCYHKAVHNCHPSQPRCTSTMHPGCEAQEPSPCYLTAASSLTHLELAY